MWYKTALKYNYFGQLIQGNPKNQFKVRNFAEEEDLENEEDIVNQDLPLDIVEDYGDSSYFNNGVNLARQ